jgi:tetratricopeptide (TPR) repeat protein
MATKAQTDPRNFFAPCFLPWLLAAVAFIIYWLTLNRWVSLFNLDKVAKISSWTWQPDVTNPISFLATYPFRWLSAAEIPVALNIFSAACAALTLGLLARSVSILPHDRTDAQRAREHNGFSFLTIRSAWLPPVLAVAVCGWQITFWEQATNYTGEMLDLLLFAFVIWSLLEYRLDESEGRLFLAAFVYGAGMADNWAMVGFFPVFIGAIIWTRGLNFFKTRFLTRMMLFGLLGVLFYLLLPSLAVFSHKMPVPFWQVLKYNLSSQFNVVRAFFANSKLWQAVGFLSLTSLLPVFVLAIRWSSTFGDSSRLGISLTGVMFHLVYAVFLVACIWVAFDSPISPRHLGLGLPFLTFYYLGALSIGYYSGYFLLVFGSKIAVNRAQRLLPSRIEFLNLPIVTGVWLLSILAMAGLVYKNGPQIRAVNDDTFQKYTTLMEKNLPRSGGILLSDDSRRAFFVEAALVRDNRAKDFLLLDTQSLPVPAYHRYLHENFPKRWTDTVTAGEQTNGVGPLHLVRLLAALAKSNELYYLHPSFGYYFEQFYLEPHGLIYKLQTLPQGTLLPPSLDKNQIAENEAFWAQAEKTAFAPIERALALSAQNAPQSFGEKLLAQLYIERETNWNAVVAGNFYSRSLDFWGVQLQRSGELDKAAANFELAQKLNPDNAVARINLEFNQQLRAGKPASVDLTKVTLDQFSKFRSWNEVLDADGPFDDPGFCFANGLVLARGNLFRQAITPFNRVRQLVPDDLNSRLWLGQLYVVNHLPDRALEAINEVREQPEKFSLTGTNKTQLAFIEAAAYFQKNDSARGTQLLEAQISSHPTNDDLLIAATQIYVARGLFTNALAVIDRKLEATPDDPAWLLGKGCVCLELKDYDAAIATLNRALALQTTNGQALYFRANAYLASGKLDAALADYEKLQNSFPNSFQVAYGLGEIAWRKHETNEAIKNYDFFLASVNTNTSEAKTILERLRELNGKSP